MAELATIARPYAEALFKSAQADLNGVTPSGSSSWPPSPATSSCCSLPTTPRSPPRRCST
jgi:hypothetical protein